MKKTAAVILTLIMCLLMALSSSAGDVHFGTGTVLPQSQEENYDGGTVSPQQQTENYDAGTAFTGYQASIYDTGSEGLALKAEPDINSQRYFYIPEGALINIDSISGGWGHTVYNGTGGWIALKYTRVIGDCSSESASYGYISPEYYIVVNTEGEGLEVRTKPTSEASTFGPCYDGTVVQVMAIEGNWAYVSANGHYGWMYLEYLRPWDAPADFQNNTPASQNSPVWNNASDPRSTSNLPQEQASAEKDPSGPNSTGTFVVSANIAQYNGVTYMLARNNQISGLTALPVTPAIYPHIGAFAFYNGRVYYCSREAGTSDYHTALCTCLPDGSDQKILLDSAQAGDSYFMTRFLLKDDKIYFTQSVSGNITYCYYDLASDSLITYADPAPEIKDMLSNMRYQVSDGNGTYYTSAMNGSGTSSKALYYRDPNGNEILAATSDLSLEIEALTSDYLYFSKFDNGNADLYRINRSTQTAEYLDGHPAVGGGIYFNW